MDWTQVQLAAAAQVPLNDVKSIEAGQVDTVEVGRLRKILAAEEARLRLVPWWNGAAADRLLDERHAALVERCVTVLRARGWRVDPELSFSEFGERGSIDIFGSREDRSAVAVCEVKSILGSLEETNRVLDVKERLAPTIAFKRLGWRPSVVGRLLILPRTSANRHVVDVHRGTMESVYPVRSRGVRVWLRSPNESIRGIWFLAD